MEEAEYRKHFDIVRNGISSATSAFCTYIEINKFASESQENYNKKNRDAYFWGLSRCPRRGYMWYCRLAHRAGDGRGGGLQEWRGREL